MAGGTSSSIVTRPASFCTPPISGDDIDFESQLFDGSGNKFALAGMIRYPGEMDWHGYAANTNASSCEGLCTVDDYMNTTMNGNNKQYAVIYSTSSSALEMWAAGNKEKTTGFDPTKSGPNQWAAFWTHQWETNALLGATDCIPGTAASKQNWTSMAYAPNKWDGSGSFGFQDVGDLTGSDLFAQWSTGGNPAYNEVVNGSAMNTWSSC